MHKIFATTRLFAVRAGSPGTAAQLEAPAVAAAQLQVPGGVGGCIFLGISREMRLATMAAYAGGGPSAIGQVPNLRREVYEPARRCSAGGDINRDDALLVAFTSTVMKSTNALKLSSHGLGQARLDAVWAQSTDTYKAPFVSHAEAYFSGQPARGPSVQATTGLVDALALPPSDLADTRGDILNYFQAVALNEMAEARLANAAGR